MNIRILSLGLVLLSILLLPACITGCGVDDTDNLRDITVNTLGPGNHGSFVASGTGS